MEVGLEALSLSVEEDEEEKLALEDGETDDHLFQSDFCLIGRFLTDRTVNFNAMRNTLASVWKPVKRICIEELSPQLYIFQFFHVIDMRRMLEGGPWTFNNHLLILHHLQKGEVIPSAIPLFHVSFWVQIHDLPFGYMSVGVGKQLGNFIGEFLEYDANNNVGIWRNYMRIRVRIDVRVPLKRRKKIRKGNGECSFVQFKYERLGRFCFLCGLLGHTEKFCKLIFSAPETELKREWGLWLKAPTTRKMAGAYGERWLRDEGVGDSNAANSGIQNQKG